MFLYGCFVIGWVFSLAQNVQAAGKVSCFYNASATHSKGHVIREIEDELRISYDQLMDAAPYCTHFVYGFLGIDEHTYQVKLLNPMDIESKFKDFQNNAKLKKRNPSMKLLLSVGGFLDPKPHPYFKVLETNNSRAIFVKSLVAMVEANGFDGADLAWQFPTHEEKRNEPIDDTSVGFAKKHRAMFGHLVKELSAELTRHKRLLTLTALPNIRADEFVDFETIKDRVEHIHLMTYDYKTPWRSPYEADYVAPLYYVKNRNENRNIQQTVNWWIKQNVPAERLLIAIPTFGRSWRIDKTSNKKMEPPVKTNGTSEKPLGYLSDSDPGTLGYYEICDLLTTADVTDNPKMLKMVRDKEHHFGSYAYRRGDEEHEGMWVSFEEPNTAAEKAKFAKRAHLGGVAIVDLSLDDFSGWCTDDLEQFPILRAAVS